MRLRRSDPSGPGYRRRRRGRGFSYAGPDGRPVTDRAELERFRSLVIPPAWSDVWICPDARGHLQAVGVDNAGRRQYLYHPQWRAKRDAAKFDHILDVGRRLPDLRKHVDHDLCGKGLSQPRVLASIARLLDMGGFRTGGDQYASGDDPSFGVATLRPEHARARGDCIVLEFNAKGGIEQTREVTDPEVCEVLRALRRRRRGEERLFAYWADRRWSGVRADEINAYLREASGGEMTAKDFRTWHATVRAATLLATDGGHRAVTRRRRVVAGVMREVAELLGNTPTVARASYVHPRVVDLYHDGEVARLRPGASRETVERAVLDLLS